MLITLKSIVFSPTKYRTFAHQSIVLSPTSTIVLSPTAPIVKPTSMLESRERNYARASLTYLTFLTQNLGGALPPLQTTLPGRVGMRASASSYTYFCRCNYKILQPSSVLLKRFPSRKRAPPIYRTAQARQALDRCRLLQLVCSYASWRHQNASAFDGATTNC